MALPCKLIRTLIDPPEVNEGVGAVVKRPIGTANLRHLDPFLFLDHFSVSPPHGFPKHPHRGFEAIIYILSGAFLYDNNLGESGVLRAGDAQRIVTGRGIIHAEQAGAEETEGLMLWVNQPASAKLCSPSSRNFTAEQIPKAQGNGVAVEVIAGRFGNLVGPCSTSAQIQYLIVHMQPETSIELESPEAFTTVMYVLQGEVDVQGQCISHFQVAVFENVGSAVCVHTKVASNFAFLQGLRIGEPIAQHGPYIMNLREECLAAQVDYNHEQNGFEGAQQWQSRLDIR